MTFVRFAAALRRTIPRPVPFALICAAVAIALAGVPGLARAQSDPVYDANGFQPGRDYSSSFPFEHIDTVSGNLVLTFTDLSLPGNAGFNLTVVRTYNSRDGKWRFGIAGVPLRFTQTGSDLSNVDFLTPDGSTHNAAGAGATTMTVEFWRLTKSTRTLEMPNGVVATYGHMVGNDGYLTEIRDPFDNTITLTWESGTGHLQSLVQDLHGHSRTVTFANWRNDIVDDVTFNGRVWSYSWTHVTAVPEALDVLNRFSPPAGGDWAFTYTTDGLGGSKLGDIWLPAGAHLSWDWGTETFPSTPSSRVVVEGRHVTHNVPAAAWTFDWQPGTSLTVTGPANKITYSSAAQANGDPMTSTRVVADLSGNTLRTDTYTYEVIDNPVEPTPAIKTHTIVQDGRTFTTTYSYASTNYGDYGQPNQVQESGELSRTMSITYKHDFSTYIRGRVATVSGPVSQSRSYDSTTGFLLASTAAGVTTTYEADATGNVKSVTDANGHRTTFTYEWGVVKDLSAPLTFTTREINSDGTVASETSGGITTTYQRDAIGRVTSVSSPGHPTTTTAYTTTSVTVTQGPNSVTTQLDGVGRAVHTQTSDGVESRTEYSAAGRVVYQSYPFGGSTPESGDTQSFDALGRLTSVHHPDGSVDTFAVVGNQSRTTRQVSATEFHTTSQTYAAYGDPSSGRLVRVNDPTGVPWDYEYNSAGQPTYVIAAGGAQLRHYQYDAHGFLSSATDPESGTTTYTHDAVGNVLSTTDARGTTIGYRYDANDRLTAIDPPGALNDVAIAYDGAGRLATIQNNLSTTSLSYDSAGRLAAQTDVISGRSFTQQFAYDANDRLVTHWYPRTGRRVDYTYDAFGRLSAVTTQVGGGPAQTLASGFTYAGTGALASFQYGNGLTRSLTFDARQRPQDVVNGPLQQTYTYDFVGNVTAVADARPGFSSTYQYDVLDRLVAVFGYGSMGFTYDSRGNRLSAGTTNYTYDAQGRLDHVSGGMTGSFTYDAAGNTLSDPTGVSYTYNAFSKAQTSTLNGVTTVYGYGPDGQRRTKRGPDGLEHYFITDASGLIGEFVPAGPDVVPVREYINLGGVPLAAITPDAGTPPDAVVTIATPTMNQTLTPGQSITLTAIATVSGGVTVSRVEYYTDGVLTGQATSGSYAVPLTNQAITPGPHILLARLVMSDGRAVTSAPITFVTQ